MYKVIKYFTDLHDKNHPYNVGDAFPREGIRVTEERLAELAGSENRQKTPLIELVEEASKGAAPEEAGAEQPAEAQSDAPEPSAAKKTTAKKSRARTAAK